MIPFEVTILGCGSAKPTLRHHTSSQVISYQGKLYMIDCGEGSQRQFQKLGFHHGQLEHIFISHGHGDHCLGLIGLLSTLSLDKRHNDINIYIPADLEQIIQAQIDYFVPNADFGIHLHPINCQTPTEIFSDKCFNVTALPLNHRIPCYGFLFREQPGMRHIKPECIQQHDIPHHLIDSIRRGTDFTTSDGQVIPNEVLTTPPSLTRSYAYISDTRPMMEYAELLRDTDLLYHEATYCEGDEALANQYYHSTASEAAEFAKACETKKLLLGHFSSRYHGEEWLLERAVEHYPHITLADEGLRIKMVDKTDSETVFIEWRR